MPRKESSKKRTLKAIAQEDLGIKPEDFLSFDDILKVFEESVKESGQITSEERTTLLQGISHITETLTKIQSKSSGPIDP